MSELKYSGLAVAVGFGVIASFLLNNWDFIFIGAVVGILYEVIEK